LLSIHKLSLLLAPWILNVEIADMLCFFEYFIQFFQVLHSLSFLLALAKVHGSPYRLLFAIMIIRRIGIIFLHLFVDVLIIRFWCRTLFFLIVCIFLIYAWNAITIQLLIFICFLLTSFLFFLHFKRIIILLIYLYTLFTYLIRANILLKHHFFHLFSYLFRWAGHFNSRPLLKLLLLYLAFIDLLIFIDCIVWN